MLLLLFLFFSQILANEYKMIFQNPVPLATEINSGFVVTTADLNHDSFPDVIFACADGIFWVQTQEDWSGLPRKLSTISSTATYVAAGDFDDDGFDDLLVFDAPNIAWYRQIEPSYTEPIFNLTHVENLGNQGPKKMVIEDFNGDGHDDVTFIINNVFYFFRSSSDGTPELSVTINLLSPPLDYKLTHLNPNQDSRTAVIFLQEFGPSEISVYVYNNDDSLAFDLVTQVTTTLSPLLFAVWDVNGDGLTDLAIVPGSADQIIYFQTNETFGNFLEAVVYQSNLTQITHLEVGDIDGNSHVDVVCVSAGNLVSISSDDGEIHQREIYSGLQNVRGILLTPVQTGDWLELLMISSEYLFFFRNMKRNHADFPTMFFMHSDVNFQPQPMFIWDSHRWYFDVWLTSDDTFYFDAYGNGTQDSYFGAGDSEGSVSLNGPPINVTVDGIYRVSFVDEYLVYSVVSETNMFGVPFEIITVPAQSQSVDMTSGITPTISLETSIAGSGFSTQAVVSFEIPNASAVSQKYCLDRFGLIINEEQTSQSRIGFHKFLIKSVNASFWQGDVVSHLGTQLNAYRDVTAGISQVQLFTSGKRYLPLPHRFFEKAVKETNGTLSLSLEIIHTNAGYLAFASPSNPTGPPGDLALDIALMNCPQFSSCGWDNICACDYSYFGNLTHCVPDPCFQSPCQNLGKCTPYSEFDYSCSCRPGWIGHDCEIEESTTVHLPMLKDVTVAPDSSWDPLDSVLYIGGNKVDYFQVNASALTASNFCTNYTSFYFFSHYNLDDNPMQFEIIGLQEPWEENLSYATLPAFKVYGGLTTPVAHADGGPLDYGFFRIDIPGKLFRASPFNDTFSYRISIPAGGDMMIKSNQYKPELRPFALSYGIRCQQPNTQCSGLYFPDDPISCICRPGFTRQGVLCVPVVTLIPPEPTEITPLLSSYLGTNVTARGQNFLPGMVLIVMAPETNATIAQFSFSNPTLISTNPSVYEISFTAPVYNVTGYVLFKFVNIWNGGSRTLNDFYYTSDCPFPGQYGIGLTCKDCPVGAICPGGNRMWPDEGFWNVNETVGFVLPCPPPADRCLGGRFSLCDDGYQGDLCGSCAANFYYQNGVCLPCTGFGSTAILFLADIVVSVVLVITTAFLRTSIVRVVTIVLSFSQILRTSGRLIEPYLPSWMLPIYSVLSLSALDPEFSRPGCLFGDGDFFVSFYWTLVFLFSAIVLIAICVLLETFFLDPFALTLNKCFSSIFSFGSTTTGSSFSTTSLNTKATNTYITIEDFMAVEGGDIDIYEGDLIDAQELDGEWGKGKCHRTGRVGKFPMQCVRSTEKRHTHSFRDWQARSPLRQLITRAWRKWVRGTVIFLTFSYSSIALRSFQGIYCFPSVGKFIIGAQQDQECLNDPHKPIFSISVSLLVLYILGLPLTLFFILFKNRHQLQNHRLRHSLGYIYSHFEDKYFYFGFFWLAVLMFQSLAVAINNSALSQTLISGIPVGVFLLLVLILRPFKARTANATAMVLLSGALIIVILSNVSLTDQQLLAVGLTYIVASFVGFLIVLLYPVVERLFCTPKSEESNDLTPTSSKKEQTEMYNIN